MCKLLACIGLVLQLAAAGLVYPTAMIVTDVDQISDVVTVETATGYVYQFGGVEDYAEGDLVALVMWSGGTSDIIDDVIITARYSGFWVE